MKKRVIVLFLLVLVLGFAVAQDNVSIAGSASGNIDRAYQCLKEKVNESGNDGLSLSESIFSVLALGSNSELEEVINNEKGSVNECWPKSRCAIKETAQVLLAYDRIGKNTDKIEEWLLSNVRNSNELTWYLEIDISNHKASECTLRYDSVDRKINVREDMTLEGNAGNCFSIAYGGYWLGINNNCLDKEFEISCNEDFITTLAYQKSAGGTIFVSSETHSSASLGTTNEKVTSKCFGINNCDYEGTLWAAIVLEKKGKDVKEYIPYLLALAEDNQKYFPSSFLYILTNGDEQYAEVIQKQKNSQYWDIAGSPYNRFYDTSVAMLGLTGSAANELDSAKNYLLSIQTRDGCWNNNNIRDTAFVLYSGWPRSVPRVPGGGGGGGGSGGGLVLCESSGYSCENRYECVEAGGDILYNYDCSNVGGLNLCCSIKVSEQGCEEKGGLICGANQQCTGRIESSIDGSCCIGGGCVEKKIENVCEVIKGGFCRTDCLDKEEETSDSCTDAGELCCIASETPEIKERPLLPWIIVLSVLILLLILGIIFRNKIRMWWYRRKGKVKTERFARPPPTEGMAMARPRFAPQRFAPSGRAPTRMPEKRIPEREKTPQDKELEETMRKLKEMSE